MKITIDETQKTIEISESVNLKELFDYLQKLNINLEDYTLIIKPSVVYTFPPKRDGDNQMFSSPTYPPYTPQPTAKPWWWEYEIICQN
jgi:hypothetical protein